MEPSTADLRRAAVEHMREHRAADIEGVKAKLIAKYGLSDDAARRAAEETVDQCYAVLIENIG